MKHAERRLLNIQTELDNTIRSLQRLSIEAKTLIKEERQGDNESRIEDTASTEEPPSFDNEDETHILSSDGSDFEQAHLITATTRVE